MTQPSQDLELVGKLIGSAIPVERKPDDRRLLHRIEIKEALLK